MVDNSIPKLKCRCKTNILLRNKSIQHENNTWKMSDNNQREERLILSVGNRTHNQIRIVCYLSKEKNTLVLMKVMILIDEQKNRPTSILILNCEPCWEMKRNKSDVQTKHHRDHVPYGAFQVSRTYTHLASILKDFIGGVQTSGQGNYTYRWQ